MVRPAVLVPPSPQVTDSTLKSLDGAARLASVNVARRQGRRGRVLHAARGGCCALARQRRIDDGGRAMDHCRAAAIIQDRDREVVRALFRILVRAGDGVGAPAAADAQSLLLVPPSPQATDCTLKSLDGAARFASVKVAPDKVATVVYSTPPVAVAVLSPVRARPPRWPNR